MFGLKERPYSAHVLISFWCDSDNKNYDFFAFQNFSGYFSFVHFGYHLNLVIYLYTPDRIISKFLQYAYLPWGICPVNFFSISASSTKSKMATKILYHSLELELLH